MKKWISLVLVLVSLLSMFGCRQEQTVSESKKHYTYEDFEAMPADELLDLFIQNGLVINDELKAANTQEALQALFKVGFYHWSKGSTPLSHTMYFDLAEKTKAIYDKLTTPQD